MKKKIRPQRKPDAPFESADVTICKQGDVVEIGMPTQVPAGGYVYVATRTEQRLFESIEAFEEAYESEGEGKPSPRDLARRLTEVERRLDKAGQ